MFVALRPMRCQQRTMLMIYSFASLERFTLLIIIGAARKADKTMGMLQAPYSSFTVMPYLYQKNHNQVACYWFCSLVTTRHLYSSREKAAAFPYSATEATEFHKTSND